MRIVWLVLALAAAASAPAASGATTVPAGKARFQFLTATLLRMEYSPSATFADAPSAVVVKRDWPQVTVQSHEEHGWLVATTGAMTVRYRLGSGAFAAANLEVSWKDRGGAQHRWHPGDVDAQNLGGLNYSLDNISAANLPTDGMDLSSPVNDSIPGIDLVLPKALPGLLSRSGYAFIDDSATPLWNAQRSWIEPRRERGGDDWYLFAYGRDYARALGEYAQLCGPIPMIPRYALGAMITDFNFEYFPGSAESQRPDFRRYDQRHLMRELAWLRGDRIPFDMLVLDFAWHNYGWDGGYDWSPLFPQPLELMRALHERGIKLSLNDHPGYIHTNESILSFEDSHAPAVLAALGRPQPAKASFDLDISHGWSFATDAEDAGLKEQWFASGAGRAHWRPIRVGLAWEEQGLEGYRGVGWYRIPVDLPARLPAKLYLYLGEVRKSYQLFVNGQEAASSRIHWPQRLTWSEITPYVSAGARNEIVLRVEPDLEARGPERRDGLVLGPTAIRDVVPPQRIYFDLSDRKQAEVFMRELHGPLMSEGVDVWWVDGGSGSVDMPGLNRQLWTNKVYYDFSEQQTGKRAFILGRYGDWGSERYPGFFTGDTYSEWPVLAYEVAFSARGGNVLIPYISHDIGGFHGKRVPFDLYARWIEFGAFSGILRMHSAHENPREGNTRMPWLYGRRGIELMRKYFTLRAQLIPYIYSFVWVAHRDSLPILRPLYLESPELEEAYRHSHEYLFGDSLLIAPVLSPSGKQTVWLPPGDWLGFFDGKRYTGGSTFTAHYAVDEVPAFVRAGAIIPEQGVSEYSDAKPLDPLILNVYGSGSGRFDLYEDDGASLGTDDPARHALTPITHRVGSDGVHHLVIEPTAGAYPGQPPARSYELRVHGAGKPSSISVDGRGVGGWRWDAQQETASVRLAAHS
ncbi:MAG TPA: TIM-barrel domain-containing protein, partial [Steroidobacteraceae bacterium]|nr:TIM-barrel domain-containing protein [Steroidobacteraceae bacterium]